MQYQSLTQVLEQKANPDFYPCSSLTRLQEQGYCGEVWLTRKNQSHFPAYVIINSLQQENATEYFLLLELDISERKQLENELRHNAETDPLTKLCNRNALFHYIENAIASAKRFHYSVALLFLDLDGFKQVNDCLGHGEGDKLLIEVAQRLRSSVRQVDTVARLGGDEFVVILNGTSKELIERTAQRIINLLTFKIKQSQLELCVSVSLGIAVFPDDNPNPLILLKFADEAMYRAKSRGKQQFCWYTEPGYSSSEPL